MLLRFVQEFDLHLLQVPACPDYVPAILSRIQLLPGPCTKPSAGMTDRQLILPEENFGNLAYKANNNAANFIKDAGFLGQYSFSENYFSKKQCYENESNYKSCFRLVQLHDELGYLGNQKPYCISDGTMPDQATVGQILK